FLALEFVDSVASVVGNAGVVYFASRSFYILAGPFSDLLDLLAHHLGGRRETFDGPENVMRLGGTVAVDEGSENAVLYRSFDLGSREVLALIHELVQVELIWFKLPLSQMNFENLRPVIRL